MKIIPISNNNFAARIVRDKSPKTVRLEHERQINNLINAPEMPKSEASQEKQRIDTIYKNTVELDYYLHSLPVLEKAENLPSLDEFYIDYGNFDDGHMHLYYTAKSKRSDRRLDMLEYDQASDLTFLDVPLDREGKIDRPKIMAWINKVYQFFG